MFVMSRSGRLPLHEPRAQCAAFVSSDVSSAAWRVGRPTRAHELAHGEPHESVREESRNTPLMKS